MTPYEKIRGEKLEKRDSSIGRTSPRSPSWSECQPTYAAMGNLPLVGTRYTE